MGSGTQIRRREDSGRLPSLPCPSCGANLFVTCFQTGFRLLCQCGRHVESGELAATPHGELAAGLQALREMWEDRLAALRTLSADALSKHQPQVSMVLDRHILNLAARLELLRRLHPGT